MQRREEDEEKRKRMKGGEKEEENALFMDASIATLSSVLFISFPSSRLHTLVQFLFPRLFLFIAALCVRECVFTANPWVMASLHDLDEGREGGSIACGERRTRPPRQASIGQPSDSFWQAWPVACLSLSSFRFQPPVTLLVAAGRCSEHRKGSRY